MSDKIDLSGAADSLKASNPYREVAPGMPGYTAPTSSPLFMLEAVDIRTMTARDEDILSSRALIRKGTVLTTLIKACVTNKMIDPDQMVAGDRTALLIAIRNSGYGAEYDPEVQCPVCDGKFRPKFKMDKLELKMLDEDPVAPGTNAFEFVLPVSCEKVTYKLLTGLETAELERTQENLRRIKGPDAPEETVTSRLVASIVSIGGNSDKANVAKFVRTMPARDSFALRMKIDEIQPDVLLEQQVTCALCGAESKVEAGLDVEFFWPSARRK
jgi:hypothetical protein